MTTPIERAWRRLQQVVARVRLTTVDDTGNTQKLQATGGAPGEVIDKVRRMSEYGFTSVPPAGTDAIILFPAGERSNGVIIATNNQQLRLKNLGDGDVAIFDNRGRMVKLTLAGVFIEGGSDVVSVNTGGPILINGGSDVTIGSSTRVVINADLFVNGATNFAGTVRANGHSIDETHIHTGGTILGKTGPVTP